MQFLEDTCTEAGPNVTYEIIHTPLQADQDHGLTKLDEDSWWWSGIQKALESMYVWSKNAIRILLIFIACKILHRYFNIYCVQNIA